jgi:hypothetical protein
MAKIFVPQPIPEAAAELLQELGEVTIYQHTDRQIPQAELDLSHFSAAPGAHLSGDPLKAKGLFQPNVECLRRGL